MSESALTIATQVAESAPVATGRRRLRRLWSSPAGIVGLAIVTVLVIISIRAALGLTPYPPLEQNPDDRFAPPSTAHWMGTDQFGRDVVSRVMEGILASLRISAFAVAIAAAIGSAAGIAAGFFGRW